MPSSYTPSLRLTLPVTGELAGTWGSTVNTGVTTLAEAAIAGTAAVAMTDADYTLTVSNGATDQARNMFITLTGTLTVSRNVICPSVSKLYVVTNNTTGSQNIVFKTSAGAGITVANGQRKMVYCNGTDVLDATTSFTSIIFDAGTVSAPSITFAGSTNTGFWRPAVSTVALSTAGLERLRVDSSGNVGIGTSSPATKLQVVAATANIRLEESSAGAKRLEFSVDSTAIAKISANQSGQSIAFETVGSERMRLDASGNLGIGTASTGNYRLRVDATNRGLYVTTAGATAALPSVYLADSTHGVDIVLTPENGYGRFGTFTNSPLAFITNNTERMRLDASGNLGIGTNAPSTRLQAYDATSATIRATSGASANLDLTANAADVRVGTPNGVPLLFLTGGSERARLDSSGNLGIGTSSPIVKLAIQDTERLEFGGSSGVMYSQTLNAARTATVESRAYASFLSWWTGASGSQTEKMRLDSSGNLGLGVTPSAVDSLYYRSIELGKAGCGISSATNSLTASELTWVTSNCYPTYSAGIVWKYGNSGLATRYALEDGAHQWYTAPSGTAGTAITFTQAMTLDASNRLFVGTSSGAAGFNLNSGVNQWFGMSAASTAASYGVFYKGGTTTVIGILGTDGGGILGGGSGDNFGIRAENALLFMSGAAERARLDSSGNLGLGVEPSAWSGYTGLQVKATVIGGIGTSDNALFGSNAFYDGTNFKYINSTTATLYRQLAASHAWYTAPSGTAGNAITFTQAMTLDASGNLGIGKTTPQASLDYRQTVNVISTNTNAVASRTYVATASLTLTLPATPTAGDWIEFVNASSSSPTIGRNGRNIMSLAEDMTVNSTNASFKLAYADATRGWVLSL